MPVTPAELARTLLRRERAARAAMASDALRLRQQLGCEVGALLERGLARRAWLIGSLAWGTFGERSDVDLVLEGLAREAAAPLWARLGERLGVPVDLLRLEDLPDAFRRRVLAEGIPLHVA